MLNTNDAHRKRLKDKYLKGGIEGFLDYEILELFLTYASPRKDCKQNSLSTFTTNSTSLKIKRLPFLKAVYKI